MWSLLRTIFYGIDVLTTNTIIDSGNLFVSILVCMVAMSLKFTANTMINRILKYIVRVPDISKMVIGGRRVTKTSFIAPARRPHWKLENQCLVNFKSCKSVEINSCITQHMTF